MHSSGDAAISSATNKSAYPLVFEFPAAGDAVSDEARMEQLLETYRINHGEMQKIKAMKVEKDEQEEKLQSLEAANTQLRRTLADLYNRQTFVETRVTENENWVKQKKAEDVHAAIVAQNETHQSTQLIPWQEDISKLPVRYNDKTFPFISLPLMHVSLFFRSLFRKAASVVVPTDASLEGTRQALREADYERQLINIMRIQRKIGKVQTELAKSVRNNRDSLVYEVGPFTNDVVLLATGLQRYFLDVGYRDVKVTSSQDKVFLHIEIFY